MAENSVEDVVVRLEADYQDFLKQIDRAVNEAVQKLKKVDDAPKKAQGGFEQLGSFLSGKFLQIITTVGAAMVAAFAVNNIVSFFTGIAKSSIDAGAQLETFTVQFTTLLGSAEKASKRVQELIKFADMTPFETDQVIEADRLLQTFGGTVLATGENLRRVGDSAAAVNANFQEVAFWTGRMYAAIQAGRPFGEAAARLSELGILSGTTRTKMEDMQKAGADGAEIWELYATTVDTKFAGAMEKLSKTFEGVMSNLRAFQDMLLREGGATLFEGVREDAVEFYDIINQPEAKEALVSLAKGFGEIASALEKAVAGAFLETIKDIDPADIKQLGDALSDFAKALATLVAGEGAADAEGFIEGMTVAIDGLTIQLIKLNEGVEVLRSFGVTLSDTSEMLNRIANPATNISVIFRDLNEQIAEFTGQDMSDTSREMVNAIDDQDEAAEAAKGAYEGMRQAMSEAAEAAKELADAKADEALAKIAEEAEKAAAALNAAKEAAADLVTEFGDAVKENNEKLQELETDHGEKVTEIDADLVEKQTEIADERNEALAELEIELGERKQKIIDSYNEAILDLEEEITKKRTEINQKAEDQLGKLASDSNKSVDKLREDHRVKEKRATEDHQRDMAKLQESYLFDLQDAVKSRDARAIVDLRRRNQLEKREREQSFRTDQRQEGSDLNKRIREVRDSEKERRNEILKNQRDELEELEVHEQERRDEIEESKRQEMAAYRKYEDEKRADIQESYDEQMEKAQEAHDEQMERESERYEERKQALDEALQKRLEDVAKELADEKDINEKGAKAILEALMKTFGVGGDIDKMMEDFAARRQQKLTIQIDVENDIRDMPGSEDRGTPNERGRMGPPPRRFAKGGLVPGPINAPVDAIVHGGEWVIPHEDVMEMIMTRQSNATGAMNHRFAVDVNMKGIPANMDQRSLENVVAGIFNRALNEAGIGK